MERLRGILTIAIMMLAMAGAKSCVREHGYVWDHKQTPLATYYSPQPLAQPVQPQALVPDGADRFGPTTFSPLDSGSSYDPNSGNAYSWTRGEMGTDVYGHNARTGSTWSSHIAPNGDQRGADADGNLWSYDAQTGSYLNSNGETCIGKGEARTCSGGR